MELAIFNARHCRARDLTSTLDEQGYVILTEALDGNELGMLREELEPHFAARPVSQALFFGNGTTRIEALFTKSLVCRQMAMHPLVLEAAEYILGPHCDHFQINLTQGIRIHPGEMAQILHPDSALFPISHKPFEFVLNALWAYSDFRKENGATVIVPGSHRWEEGRQPEPLEITQAEMPAGAVLIYAASLLHGGGANDAGAPRTGVAIGYCLGWLRQSENQYLSYPPEVARHFSEPLQRLIGYRVHRPNLGWVHGHDPSHLIRGTDTSRLGAEDFLTDEQTRLMQQYHRDASLALTSHNLKAA
jgi:ectoine hydroxylase-related dioxygenase (phytanoyl-CoA dioxygenase family)